MFFPSKAWRRFKDALKSSQNRGTSSLSSYGGIFHHSIRVTNLNFQRGQLRYRLPEISLWCHHQLAGICRVRLIHQITHPTLAHYSLRYLDQITLAYGLGCCSSLPFWQVDDRFRNTAPDSLKIGRELVTGRNTLAIGHWPKHSPQIRFFVLQNPHTPVGCPLPMSL